jgi:hypothetical protein
MQNQLQRIRASHLRLIFAFTLAIFGAFSASATTITVGGVSFGSGGLTSAVSGGNTVTFHNGLPANYSGGSVVTGTSAGNYVPPTGDTTRYLTFGSGTVTIDYTSAPIEYFGLYWSTIDTYNTITFYGAGAPETINGSEVASLAGVAANGTNSAYVNFFAAAGTSWNKVVLSSPQNAFESDNHVTVAAVPEPGTWSMLLGGGGLVAIAAWLRKRVAV